MDKLSDLKPGDVLGQVDLATYIGAMGKGVAEAQRALDDNTIGLLGAFTQKLDGLGGKSLIQLGLSPAFYHFRSATLSASVNMSIQVRQEIDVKVHVEAGKSQESKTKITSGSKETTSASETIHLSESKKIQAASSGNTIQKIDSYAAANSASSEQFALAERAAVLHKTEFEGGGVVKYNSNGALFVVQPAGKRWAVLAISGPSTSGETFAINATGPTYHVQPQTTAQVLAGGVASHAQGMFVALLSPDPAADDLKVVRFTTGSHVVKPIDGVDYAARLRALAHIIAAAGNPALSLIGHTDGIGPKAYNQRLSLLRAQAVKDVLVANGVNAQAINVSGVGETFAVDDVADPQARNVTIGFTPPLPGYFIYLCEVSGSLNSGISVLPGTGNRWAAVGQYDVNGAVNGATASLASDVVAKVHSSSKAEGSDISELVYLTNREENSNKIAKISVYAATGKSLESSEASDLVLDKTSSQSGSSTQRSETEINRASAVAGSLDARYSRMFDVSMSGNMSIAAELVSVPAPPEFLQFIKDNQGD
jgi:outer membrane protein OmpA-like peptidoglycan-associated protein